MLPPVSIIVPVCDVAPWLERCIDSLLAQSLPNLEIILVDDASVDKSPTICAHYAAQYPGTVRYITLPRRQGPGAARNAGMAQAQGEYLGFVDSDDAVAPEMFAELYACANNEKADIVVCGFHLISESGVREILPRTTGKLQMSQLLLQRKIQPSVWNKLFRKSFVSKAQAAFPKTFCAEDMAFVFMLMTEHPSIYSIKKAYYTYYCNKSGLTSDMLRRKYTFESLDFIKNNLIIKGNYNRYKYEYAYLYVMHAVYYPLHLFIIRSIIHGENRRMNIKHFPSYIYTCCKHALKSKD